PWRADAVDVAIEKYFSNASYFSVAGFYKHFKSFIYDSVGRSEEHTSELQSLAYLVCRLLLEKKKIHILEMQAETQLVLKVSVCARRRTGRRRIRIALETRPENPFPSRAASVAAQPLDVLLTH